MSEFLPDLFVSRVSAACPELTSSDFTGAVFAVDFAAQSRTINVPGIEFYGNVLSSFHVAGLSIVAFPVKFNVVEPTEIMLTSVAFFLEESEPREDSNVLRFVESEVVTYLKQKIGELQCQKS